MTSSTPSDEVLLTDTQILDVLDQINAKRKPVDGAMPTDLVLGGFHVVIYPSASVREQLARALTRYTVIAASKKLRGAA